MYFDCDYECYSTDKRRTLVCFEHGALTIVSLCDQNPLPRQTQPRRQLHHVAHSAMICVCAPAARMALMTMKLPMSPVVSDVVHHARRLARATEDALLVERVHHAVALGVAAQVKIKSKRGNQSMIFELQELKAQALSTRILKL